MRRGLIKHALARVRFETLPRNSRFIAKGRWFVLAHSLAHNILINLIKLVESARVDDSLSIETKTKMIGEATATEIRVTVGAELKRKSVKLSQGTRFQRKTLATHD